MKKMTRPVWAEINLDNLAHNMREVKRLAKQDALITAVVKADGYGHGAATIGSVLLKNGADRFAVATLSEAIHLRKSYQDVEILVLGYTPDYLAEKVLEHRIIQTVYNENAAKALSAAAQKRNKTIKLHVKLDTGMGRIGLYPCDEAVQIIRRIIDMPCVKVEGIYSHFATADEKDKSFTRSQYAIFQEFISKLEEEDIRIPIRHICNSAGIIEMSEFHEDMVRAGIMIYGLYPSKEVDKTKVDLKPVMSLKAMVAHVKSLEPAQGISYGHKYHTQNVEKIATLPLGYADGFTRILSGKSEVLVNGVRVPVVGRICMDQCMINVTGLDVHPDDEVIIFGGSGSDNLPVEEVASLVGTINYEVVCTVDKRVPRVYTENGRIVKVRDYVLEL